MIIYVKYTIAGVIFVHILQEKIFSQKMQKSLDKY